MTEYTERELILPTLGLLEQAPSGLTTTQLIALLTAALSPVGLDARILSGRRDTNFSQKVRNLVSHRTLVRPGLATYDGSRHLHNITETGAAYLEQERGRLQPTASSTQSRAERSGTTFGDYRRASEATIIPPRRPFEVDPNELDRASTAHARTQNLLAAWLAARGLKPLSWAGGVAEFDIAWAQGSTLCIAEVKSLTPANETRQLRLGLGQVLHYRAVIRESVDDVRAILAVERAPAETRWLELCRSHGVRLVWPETFDTLASGRP